jgi:hypothetical protein
MTGRGGTPTLLIQDANPIDMFFGGLMIANNRRVVVQATLTSGGSAIISADEKSITVHGDTSGPFNLCCSPDNEGPAINSLGTVAFYTTLKPGPPLPPGSGVYAGIFTGPDPVADKVIAVGDPLFGSTVADVQFYRGMNDAGQIAFYAGIVGGPSGIFLAEPAP